MVAAKARFAHAQDIPWYEPTTVSWNELYGNPPMLGRVTGNRLRVFGAPSPNAKSMRNVYLHYIGPIYGAVRGERYDNRSWSDVWFYLGPNENGEDEYIHSAFVVPAFEVFQEGHELAEGEFFWGEISVPHVVQYKRPTLNAAHWDWDYYRCYYAQVHRVVQTARDEAGNIWYRLEDDIEETRQAWVMAKFVRRIDPAEFAPINPDVKNKKVEIDLAAQNLTAYEGGVPVFRTQIASGTSYTNPEGEEIDFSTPYGTYEVQGKRPSRRMRGGESFNLPYDVNGVPWVTYFSFTGGAIHGAFWHNNYGVPRSHGCINVTPDAARWIYRWSKPYVPYDYVSRLIAAEQFEEEHTLIEIV
jgi:hypothetical protein